jgi:hypothetical protein
VRRARALRRRRPADPAQENGSDQALRHEVAGRKNGLLVDSNNPTEVKPHSALLEVQYAYIEALGVPATSSVYCCPGWAAKARGRPPPPPQLAPTREPQDLSSGSPPIPSGALPSTSPSIQTPSSNQVSDVSTRLVERLTVTRRRRHLESP